MELILAIAVFGVCMTGLSLGVLWGARRLRPSCGPSGEAGGDASCGICNRREHDLCERSDGNGELVRIATLGTPRRHDPD